MAAEAEEPGTRTFSFGTKPEDAPTEKTEDPTVPLSSAADHATGGNGVEVKTDPSWTPPPNFPVEAKWVEESPATRVLSREELPNPTPMPEGRSGALWDTIEASGEFQPGQVIFGRYIVQLKLGRGGMGAVWLVTHRELNTDRAIKLIVAGITYDAQARARFRREAQVMAQFSHPNAVIVHDARLTENDVAYIDMEFVQGQSLDRVVRRGEPMPLPWIVRILDQLCDVLEFGHQKGIVHRDLKPANLMLVGDRPYGKEQLKVLDFGIAKILGQIETQGPHTMTGVFMGTPPYASPEQTDGQADIRSDIYSVGVLLYEFLTGHRPFSGPPARVMVDTITQPPPSFATINPAVQYPPGLEAVVMHCLAKSPDERYQTAKAVAEAFRAALPKELLGPSEKIVTRTEIVSRIPWIPILLIVVLIAFLGVMAGKNLLRRPDVTGGSLATGGNGKSGPPPPTVILPAGFEADARAERDKQGFPSILVPSGPASSIGLKFLVIRGGTFTMGDPKELTHKQNVPDFAMTDTEVTNGQMHAYFKVMRSDPPKDFEKAFQDLITGNEAAQRPPLSPEEAELHPAVFISRPTAIAFARWVKADLPTEAEWEFSARSRGLENRPYTWNGTTRVGASSRRANLDTHDELPTPTSKVRNYPDDCTVQGIYDLVGNVREWCRDSGNTPTQFAIRGGSWNSFATQYSNYKGEFRDEKDMQEDLGFRLVVELSAPRANPPK